MFVCVYMCVSLADGKASIAGLLKGLGSTQDKSLVDLSKKLSTMEEKNKPMDTPLNKIQADRVCMMWLWLCMCVALCVMCTCLCAAQLNNVSLVDRVVLRKLVVIL